MLTIEVADTYFENRLNTDVWDNAGNSKKKQALSTAENQIEMIPDIEELEEEKMNRAILEQALFLLRTGPEAELRNDLQAQGVEQVDIEGGVQERYKIQKSSIYAPYVNSLIDKLNYNLYGQNREYVIGDLI